MCLQLLISLYVLLVPHQCPSTSAHALQVPDAIKSAFGCGDPQCIEKHGLWADGTLLPFLRSMLDRLGLPQAPLTGHDSVSAHSVAAGGNDVAVRKLLHLILKKLDGIHQMSWF